MRIGDKQADLYRGVMVEKSQRCLLSRGERDDVWGP
jgi:hypothetical protein